MILPISLLFAAQAAVPPPPRSDDPGRAAAIANCNARMVEIPITIPSKTGLPKQTRVKICGKVGQSDSDWAGTLRDAMSKVQANLTMPPPVKDQIVAGIRLELAKLPGAAAEAKPEAAVASSVAPAPAPAVAAPLVPRPRVESGRVEYSALPPLPAPLPAVSAATLAAAPPPLPAPRLTLRCLSTDSLAGEGPCDLLERGMMVTVKADEDVPGGTSLRFVRRGDNRAEVDLAPLRRGQSQRFGLPAKVCQGVTGSKVEIEVVRAAGKGAQVVDTRGPFELRC